MQLVLSEDQELLAKTVADFAAEHSPLARFRALRDDADPIGFSKALWREMAELGWVGIPIPEAHGGAELGLAELCVVLEPLGRCLAPEPFLSTVLLGAAALVRGGTEQQQAAWLPRVAAGEAFLALAHQEPRSRYDLQRIETRAERDGDGWRISGEKIQVLDGIVADALIVAARTSGDAADAAGITLFLVPADAGGLEVERQHRVDERGAALVTLAGVAVDAAAIVGAEGQGARLLQGVVDAATVGLCAEMLGSMQECFDRTLAYLKAREQFGVPIGSFQALKHRAAEIYIQIELARSCVMAAARAVDAGDDEAPRLVSLTKARCSDAAILVTNEGVQMHGGIGMTDEHDIGFFLKRARAAAQTFGDADFHRARWAGLGGY
ncbi:MAG: acyl-CoA dehydrogenase family protein [Deltaproteobacteria bacterium]|nr:acyl-CoA dehydrogenase family protein [Deltaproteobacteria bacterium]MBW2361892.1 acyl-CoA dehydrogenase family protein [Deltaproteobacteria bacterium]